MTNLLSNINFTANEKIVINAMLPHQNSDFIADGMSHIKTIQNWISDTGQNMTYKTIKGIVGSLVKKGILFCEVMEEPSEWEIEMGYRTKDGVMIYFSYHYFDQQPKNLE